MVSKFLISATQGFLLTVFGILPPVIYLLLVAFSQLPRPFTRKFKNLPVYTTPMSTTYAKFQLTAVAMFLLSVAGGMFLLFHANANASDDLCSVTWSWLSVVLNLFSISVFWFLYSKATIVVHSIEVPLIRNLAAWLKPVLIVYSILMPMLIFSLSSGKRLVLGDFSFCEVQTNGTFVRFHVVIDFLIEAAMFCLFLFPLLRIMKQVNSHHTLVSETDKLMVQNDVRVAVRSGKMHQLMIFVKSAFINAMVILVSNRLFVILASYTENLVAVYFATFFFWTSFIPVIIDNRPAWKFPAHLETVTNVSTKPQNNKFGEHIAHSDLFLSGDSDSKLEGSKFITYETLAEGLPQHPE